MRKPPKFALILFRWFCHRDYLEDLEGDLLERFELYAPSLPSWRARLKFSMEVIKLFRPGLIRPLFTSQNHSKTTMLHHNLKLTFRNFLKHRSLFLVNLTGLSTGLAAVLFIYLWISDEFSIDRFHQKSDRIYQVLSNHEDASGIYTWNGVPGLLYDEIKETVSTVDEVTAFTESHEFSLSSNKQYHKAHGKFASKEFLSVFSYPLIHGDISNALNNKDGVVISEGLAVRMFKSKDVLGKQLEWHFRGDSKNLIITGVIEDVPSHSSDQFDFIMSWDYYHDELVEYKMWTNYYASIALTTSPDLVETLNQRLTSIHESKQRADNVTMLLYPYSDLYLKGHFENGQNSGGKIQYVHLFTIVAIFILIIASINFINLSTARASNRATEIGIKKSLGASRHSIMSQFFTESFCLSVISMLIAWILVISLLPQFNFLTQKSILLTMDLNLIIISFSLIVIIGFIAGLYPALVIASFNPVRIWRGDLRLGNGKSPGRKVLVIFQFTLSIILIIGVLVVYYQLDFVKNKNLGYERENLLYFDREGKLIEQSNAFIGELMNLSGVTNATTSGFMVGGGNSTGGVDWEGKTPEDQIQFWETRSDAGMITMLELEILEGRDFSKDFASDTAAVIFNETGIRAMGMENPIGKTIDHYNGPRKIIGVVKDFNLLSLHTKVEPMIFLYDPMETPYIMVKLKAGDLQSSIQQVGQLYEKFNPGYVYSPKFVDQDYSALYSSDERISLLSRYISALAIMISCLGLYGLTTFMIESRTKEIGIRKILGSSRLNIIFMLSGNLIKLVLYAVVIATPIALFSTQHWLDNFAYTVSIEWWYFAVGAGLALMIAWLTVAAQALRAASINPTDCLRDE